MSKLSEVIGIIVLFTAIILVVCVMASYPFMLIWNSCLVPAITILKPITLWQAFWISMFMCSFVRGWGSGNNK